MVYPSTSDDGNKVVIPKKKIRPLVTTIGGRKTPKDLFPDSPLISTSEWPEERDRCVIDYNMVRCPYGDKCTSRNKQETPEFFSLSMRADLEGFRWT